MAAPSFRRVALITGAAQGLGRCIALRLAKDGLNIALNDTPSKREQLEELASGIQQKLDRQTIVVPADVSSEIDVRKMTESVVGQLGGLDVVRQRCNDVCNCLMSGRWWQTQGFLPLEVSSTVCIPACIPYYLTHLLHDSSIHG